MKHDTDRRAPRALLRSAAYLAIMVVALIPMPVMNMARVYYVGHDAYVGAALAGLFIVVGLGWKRLPPLPWPERAPSGRAVLLFAPLFALALWLGAGPVVSRYWLTRDELMVDFDRYLFEHGHLALALPEQWLGYGKALVPNFLLDTPGNTVMVSGYMPVNAAMRAAFAQVADPVLLGALLAALGLICLWWIARRLFADCPGAQWLVLAGYVLSAQVDVTAMTPFAMTAHLAFNLLWLVLFLYNRWWSHAPAMAIGVAAIGLHQVAFHPLFAGPFILLLLRDRRWALFAIYAAAYAGALGFWLSWPGLALAHEGIAVARGSSAGAEGYFTSKILPLLTKREPQTVSLTFYNWLRFVNWNAAFMLPFMLIASPAVWRREGYALPLAGGLVLTALFVTFMIPFQGHGWGYRYLHGVIGSCLLLTGYGYREVRRHDALRAKASAAMLTLASLPLVGYLFFASNQFLAPYVRLTALVDAQTSRFVLLDTERPAHAMDQVRNLPDLSNRPLVFSSIHMSSDQVDELCRRGSVTLITRADYRRIDFFPAAMGPDNVAFAKRTEGIRAQPCVWPVISRERSGGFDPRRRPGVAAMGHCPTRHQVVVDNHRHCRERPRGPHRHVQHPAQQPDHHGRDDEAGGRSRDIAAETVPASRNAEGPPGVDQVAGRQHQHRRQRHRREIVQPGGIGADQDCVVDQRANPADHEVAGRGASQCFLQHRNAMR